MRLDNGDDDYPTVDDFDGEPSGDLGEPDYPDYDAITDDAITDDAITDDAITDDAITDDAITDVGDADDESRPFNGESTDSDIDDAIPLSDEADETHHAGETGMDYDATRADERTELRLAEPARSWPTDFADSAALSSDDVPPVGKRILETSSGEVLKAMVWEALYLTLDAFAIPGARYIAETAYEAVKLVSAISGVLHGDGFIYQVGIVPLLPYTCVVLRFPQASDHGLPPVMLGIDVNFLMPLGLGSPDIDGRAGWDTPRPETAEPWAGEWTMVFGTTGMRNPAEILRRRSWVFPPV